MVFAGLVVSQIVPDTGLFRLSKDLLGVVSTAAYLFVYLHSFSEGQNWSKPANFEINYIRGLYQARRYFRQSINILPLIFWG